MSTAKELQTGFAGSVPANYDECLGPFLFDSYATDLAERIDVAPGGSILETACGTGIATEKLREANPSETEIVATDLSEAMLEHARKARGSLANVRFEEANCEALPFDDRSFDAVCSQFGIMFVPDKQLAVDEAHRVLRPGGMFAFNVWSDLESNPYVRVAQNAIESFFESDPPTFLYKPWAFCALDPIKRLLVQAGFENISFHVVSRVGEQPSVRDLARGFVRGNPTCAEIEARSDANVDAVIDEVARALADAFGDAPFRAPMQAIVVTARRARD